jgi:DNA helicase II / ATP-dependent DNA helicase PcrA
MQLVADLHIHSHYSRATSKDLTFEHLARWAQLKGVQVVGTGDIAHPGWLAEMRAKLEPAEPGLYRLKDELAAAVQAQTPPACHAPVRFLLAGEISNIYKKAGATRKVHHVVFAPDLDAVERLQARLERIGNIRSDGRPILGLPSRDLLEIALETDPRCHLIPAHIWTPWFALLGSKSGYDSVAQCFEDLTPHIFALETGLSSDPPMNWRVSALDGYTLVSNSDAHSPQKLAREATLFDCELAYDAIFDALRSGDPARFKGTLEFFPEEGKYHLDGHRACGVCWEPPETLAHGGLCSVCGKPVTVGVMHRVELLADRPAGGQPARVHPFHSLVPLPEVLGQVYGVGAGSKQVTHEYEKLLARLGPELRILLETPLDEIRQAGGERLAEGIERMRRGEVDAQGGYDGEYGVIRLFSGASWAPAAQMGLFGEEREGREGKEGKEGKQGDQSGVREVQAVYKTSTPAPFPARLHLHCAQAQVSSEPASQGPRTPLPVSPSLLAGLNPQQAAAVQIVDAPLVIVAGPGTGKTRTLTVRIAYLIEVLGVAPEAILAITFTNKAAGEMAERLAGLLGEAVAGRVTIKTFHAFGAMLLREHGQRLGLDPQFVILSDDDRHTLLKQARPDLKQAEIGQALALISKAKNLLLTVDTLESISDFPDFPSFPSVFHTYETALRAGQAVDFDDLIMLPVRLLESQPDVLEAVQERLRWISVDEYQDVNLAQYRLLRLLAGGGANVCVIGDPDQAIYGFRGADRRYFLSFQQDYPDAQMLSLSQNYRSTQLILDAAMQVIGQGDQGGETPPLQAVQALAEFAEQVKLDVYAAPTDKAEAEYVVHQIEQMVGGTSYFSLDSGRVEGAEQVTARSFADFAVLYRLGAQSRLLVEAFERSGIPYQTVGQTPLAAHKAVREALACLWLLHSPQSLVHRETVLAAVGLEKAREMEGNEGNWEELVGTERNWMKLTALQRRKLDGLAAFWRELAQARQASAATARLIERVHGFMVQQRTDPLSEADGERLEQLARRAAPWHADLAGFLEAMALQSETDAYDPRADRVTLMTLHAAKGLEFPVVFIAGCEEGLLPYERPGRPVDVDEERRLFYVGVTRAQRQLVLLNAQTRFLYGQRMANAPSRFVADIEAALKEVRARQQRSVRLRPEAEQLSLF